MRYPPGSFTKNFAWHGTGFLKLHTSIRAGFAKTLAPVSRPKWRAESSINDGSLELVPINFFLWNDRQQRVAPDELVYQAVTKPHGVRFDRLALFAFNLSDVGYPGGRAAPRPALWANEFVRERLWQNGLWHREALSHDALDHFIADRMDASLDVRTKCRNNYRHFYELAGYLPSPTDAINSGATSFLAQALFLVWDRFTARGGALDVTSLLDALAEREVHKLLGLPDAGLEDGQRDLARLYVDVRGLGRFSSSRVADSHIPPETPEEVGREWLDQEESDAVVGRQIVSRLAQKRDRRKAAGLRAHYHSICMFCEVRLQVGPGKFYCEAAHIRPLGRPHDGPDKTGNMIVLCPNHHLQFDRGVIRIRRSGNDYFLVSKVRDDPLHGRKINLKHELDADCVLWHFQWFGQPRS